MDGGRTRELLGPRGIRELVEAFGERDLLVEAGALAFRASLALIPALLFVIGLLGFLGLESVWTKDVAPDFKDQVSPAAFKFVDQAVRQVLGSQQLFWVTAGAALAAWEASAIVRAAGNLMDRIYEVENERPFRRELAESIPLGAAAGLLLLAAAASVRLGPIGVSALLGDGALASVLSIVVCWGAGALLLFALVGLVVRFAPAIERPPRWLSFGAATIVGAWLVMSLAFVVYLRTFASYGSVFGNLATVFVLVEYLFLLSMIFLGGIVVDALADGRERHD